VQAAAVVLVVLQACSHTHSSRFPATSSHWPRGGWRGDRADHGPRHGADHSWICSAKPHLPQPSFPASYNQKENERYWLSGGNHNEAQKLAHTTSRSSLQIIYLYSRSKYSLYSKFCCYTYECTSSSTCLFLCAIIYILWTSVSETLLFFSTLLINRGSFVLNN